MIHNQNFPFDREEREIIHISSSKANIRKMGIKVILLSLFFASLMFGAKYAYDLGRGTKDFSQAPLVVADKEPFKVQPKERGGMEIPYKDKEIYKSLDPSFIDSEEKVTPLPEAEKPIQFDAIANLLEENFGPLDDEDLSIAPEPPMNNNLGENADRIIIPPIPGEKPQTFKLGADGKLTKSNKNLTVVSADNAKKIDISKILAKKNETEIWIQLGTFPNEQEATKAWQNVHENNSDILGEAKIKITKSDMGNKGSFYRLQSGPFDDESTARDICKAMNEREQNCFFVKQEKK